VINEAIYITLQSGQNFSDSNCGHCFFCRVFIFGEKNLEQKIEKNEILFKRIKKLREFQWPSSAERVLAIYPMEYRYLLCASYPWGNGGLSSRGC
jgi:hypothetical protein